MSIRKQIISAIIVIAFIALGISFISSCSNPVPTSTIEATLTADSIAAAMDSSVTDSVVVDSVQ